MNRLKDLGIDFEVKRLLVGDFVWNGWVIERKAINDFLSSGNSNRLYEQLENMLYNLSLGAEKAVLIIHGSVREINKHYYSENYFFGLLGQVMIDFPNVNVIFVPNETAVANVIASMYFKTYQPQTEHTWVKRTKNYSFDILRSSGFSKNQANELLKHYSLQEIYNIPDRELKSIKYIGNATAKKFIALRKKKG